MHLISDEMALIILKYFKKFPVSIYETNNTKDTRLKLAYTPAEDKSKNIVQPYKLSNSFLGHCATALLMYLINEGRITVTDVNRRCKLPDLDDMAADCPLSTALIIIKQHYKWTALADKSKTPQNGHGQLRRLKKSFTYQVAIVMIRNGLNLDLVQQYVRINTEYKDNENNNILPFLSPSKIDNFFLFFLTENSIKQLLPTLSNQLLNEKG